MNKLWIPVVVVLALVALNAFYVVEEPHQVIITQFGRPVGDPVVTPGLKVKIPFLQKVHRFEKRFLEWDGDPNQLPTRDKRFIWVNMYARWRITDPLLYFQRLNNERGAQTRLDDILDGEVRNAIAAYDLVEVVRSTNRQAAVIEGATEEEIILAEIQYGRGHIREEILANSQARTEDLGIEILDVEFKRINYVAEVQRKVYERMVSERVRIADRFKSEGQGEAFRIRGEKERELLRIQSEAYRQVQQIKGTADAEATNIYASAYDRSPDSRSFYAFLKTLETYRVALGDESTLVLTTDADIFKYLKTDGSP